MEDISFYNLSIDDVFNMCNELNHEKPDDVDICKECIIPFLKNNIAMGNVVIVDRDEEINYYHDE